MKDYWLHMVMFYCHTKFPDVKYSMQANLLGLVQPEDLTSHINDAVYTGCQPHWAG
jgi:hypothetical protein